jgi:hypothetical protein
MPYSQNQPERAPGGVPTARVFPAGAGLALPLIVAQLAW